MPSNRRTSNSSTSRSSRPREREVEVEVIEVENPNGGVVPFLWGVLAGGLVGAAFALLYAPKKGEEIRSELAGKFDGITEAINSVLNPEPSDMEDNAGRDRSTRVVDEARERAENLMRDADRTMDEARRRASTAQQSNTGPIVPPDAGSPLL